MKRCFYMALAVVAVAALVFSTAPVLADGQETGVVSGKVTDATGTPLPGVPVTLAGERGSKEAVTDGSGTYRFALVQPGPYVVTAAMEGMQEASANVNVSGGGKAEANLSLRLGTSEEITVTSEAPMVDKFNVGAGATVTSEVGEQTAGSTRTYYGVINTLPGVTSDSQNNDIQQTRPSVNGASWADNAVFIDGVDSSFSRFGGSRVFLPTTAVTEVTMEGGGSSAEYGRVVGSTTNVIVKSGTNTFKADALVQHQTVDWASDYKSHPQLLERESFPRPADFLRRSAVEEDNDSTGYELSLGGPFARDKAWFFLGWSDFDTNDFERMLNGDHVDTSLATEAKIAKFNFQPGQANQLSLSYIETPATRVYAHPNAADRWEPNASRARR